MSDNISRSALIRQIEIDADGSPGWYGDTWQFMKTIAKMPSTEPKTGHWKLTPMLPDIHRYECSNCKRHHRERYDFCPSCGADMRGEEE